mgnify:CR=1 FL=1
MKTIALICISFFSVVFVSSTVIADGFYVIPVKGQVTSWDKKISGITRFKLVLDGEAVLDRETGLVWEQSPSTDSQDWTFSLSSCYGREVANRKGWRIPTIEELMSLVDNENANPALPTGHPFSNVQVGLYWSTTSRVTSSPDGSAWMVDFINGALDNNLKSGSYYRWCVRGGHGHDAY